MASNTNIDNKNKKINQSLTKFILLVGVICALLSLILFTKHKISFDVADIEKINKTQAYHNDLIVFTIKDDYYSCVIDNKEYVWGDSTNTITFRMPWTIIGIDIFVNRDKKKKENNNFGDSEKKDTKSKSSENDSNNTPKSLNGDDIQNILDLAIKNQTKPYSELIDDTCKVGISIDGKIVDIQSYDDFIDHIISIPTINKVEVVFCDKIEYNINNKVVMFYIQETRR